MLPTLLSPGDWVWVQGGGGVPYPLGSFCFCLSLPHPRKGLCPLPAKALRPLGADIWFWGGLSPENGGEGGVLGGWGSPAGQRRGERAGLAATNKALCVQWRWWLCFVLC